MAINSIFSPPPAAPTARTAAPPPTARVERSDEVAASVAETPPALNATGQPPPSRQQVNQAMEQMREALPSVARNLQFSVDVETGRSVVRIVDSTTNEVIRQMPSEELLAIAKALDKFTGLLLKQKA